MNDDLQIEKNVFVVFYSGERAKNKILKICDAFGANRYPFTEDLGKQVQTINEVSTMILLGLFIYIYIYFFNEKMAALFVLLHFSHPHSLSV